MKQFLPSSMRVHDVADKQAGGEEEEVVSAKRKDLIKPANPDCKEPRPYIFQIMSTVPPNPQGA